MGNLGKAAVLLLLGLAALPASAGTVYRCVGSDGVSSYVTKRVPGARCAVASHFTPDRRSPRPAAPPAAAPASTAPAAITTPASAA
ncbi:hypothetical protein L613_005100000220, partial [Pseudoxanthomonas taiwanensis J19]